MLIQRQNNFFIFVGTSGTGKSALIDHLMAKGYKCNVEVTREILSTQLEIDGPGLPSKNPLLFVQMMKKLAIEQFENSKSSDGPVFFDRGMPDLIAYASRFKVDFVEFEQVASKYLYNQNCFVFPPWKEIFINDNVRRGTYEFYEEFQKRLLDIYLKLNFNLIEMPLESIEIRAEFVLSKVKALM